jgi:hypothetical protein
MPVEVDPVWTFAAASVAAIYGTLPRGSATIRAKTVGFLFPSPEARGNTGAVRCPERLGGLLKYYEREAA